MNLKTLSASSLQVAAMCMRRFVAEYITYARGFGNSAADTGSACHGALELYVLNAIKVPTKPATLATLIEYYDISFARVFGSLVKTSPEYLDGLELLKNWHSRTSFEGIEVKSCEIKSYYPIELSNGNIVNLTYIIDREDIEVATGELRVIDYKTNRVAITPQELRTKIQARLYALVKMIENPHLDAVWVVFDMLRHAPVGTRFTRKDCEDTWDWLVSEVARIINTDETQVTPRLNPDCGFCTVKATCPLLRKNIQAGGIMSLDPSEIVDLRVEIEAQSSGIKRLLEEIDLVLAGLLLDEENDTPVIEGSVYDAIMSARMVRSVDPARVAAVVSPDILNDYVKPGSLSLASFERLLKDERLPPEVVAQLKSLIIKVPQTPSIKTVKRLAP